LAREQSNGVGGLVRRCRSSGCQRQPFVDEPRARLGLLRERYAELSEAGSTSSCTSAIVGLPRTPASNRKLGESQPRANASMASTRTSSGASSSRTHRTASRSVSSLPEPRGSVTDGG
jgi:hypothetical protein